MLKKIREKCEEKESEKELTQYQYFICSHNFC